MFAKRLKVAFVLVICTVMSLSALADDNKAGVPPASSAKPTSVPFIVDFDASSGSSIIVEHDGKRYEIDTAAKTVRELTPASSSSTETREQSAQSSAAPNQQAAGTAQPADRYYLPGDDRLLTLPSGQRILRHEVWVNFTHRFPFSPAVSGPGLGHTLLGLDDLAIPSFGFQYGITDRLSVAVYRSPSFMNRPIEMRAQFRFLDEHDGQPFNATFRFSVDGENDFERNFTTNFEVVASRSITSRALLTLVPTLSVHNRPMLGKFNSSLAGVPPEQPCNQALATGAPASMNVKPCADTFSLGVGLAVDVRPTVALIAEVNPTLANARDLGIHRPPFGFAIQKKIFRHAFTLGFTTSPGTTVSQRSQTRATFLRDPKADRFSGLGIAFNLSRELR